MKIDVASDLHVDKWPSYDKRWTGTPFASTFLYIDWEQYKNEDSTVLVIAGDTADNLMVAKEVIEGAALFYEHVVIVEGNHEHYDDDESVEDSMTLLSLMLSRYPNVHYLKYDQTFVLDGVLFCGTTGWYDYKAYEARGISETFAKRVWREGSRDTRLKFKSGSLESLAMTQVVNLAEQVKQGSESSEIEHIVVVTHMSPSPALMEWKSDDLGWNALTPSYVNTGMKSVLEVDTNNKIKYWVYGHTHTRKMTRIDGVVYVNNARGYPTENPPFTLTQIELPSK